MTTDRFDGPGETEFDVAFPPQLCDVCGRALDVAAPVGDGLEVGLVCPEHGVQRTVDVRGMFGPLAP